MHLKHQCVMMHDSVGIQAV